MLTWISQVVLWDKIILRGENAMLDYRRYLKKFLKVSDYVSTLTVCKFLMMLTDLIPLSVWTRSITSGMTGMAWWATKMLRWPSHGTSSQMLATFPGVNIIYQGTHAEWWPTQLSWNINDENFVPKHLTYLLCNIISTYQSQSLVEMKSK